MKTLSSKKHLSVSIGAVSGSGDPVTLAGTLPVCSGKAAAAYYRHLERVLRRKCGELPFPVKAELNTELYQPDETRCSIRVRAVLQTDRGRFPFLDDGAVWDLRSGRLCSIETLLGKPCTTRWLLRHLLPRTEPQWMLRSCPDWEARVHCSFDRQNFILTEKTLCFLLPPLTLGPLLENICRIPLPGK